MKILLRNSQVALRKCKGNSRTLNAAQLKQEGAIEKLIHHDDGFQFRRALRGSQPYFEKAKKDLFAMIRQLRPASLFCSFSSAETQWIHLLRIIGELVAESVLVCGYEFQGVFKEYLSTNNQFFKGNSKQVYFVLNYVLNFAICHYRVKIAASDMKCILINRYSHKWNY